MTKDNAKDYLHLVQAMADGKQIQYRVYADAPWENVYDLRLTDSPEKYRIKPEAMEVWINVYGQHNAVLHFSEKEAVMNVSSNGRTAKFREVLDE